MNGQQFGQADTWATAIETFFAAHPIAKWLALAWLVGWIAAFIVRPFIRMSPLPDKIESHLVMLSCIVSSATAAGSMWRFENPDSPFFYTFIVSTIMGGSSPFGYLGLAKLLCWKFPTWKPHLSLQKDFAAAVDDEPNSPPGGTP